jgi:hypothetical protein
MNTLLKNLSQMVELGNFKFINDFPRTIFRFTKNDITVDIISSTMVTLKVDSQVVELTNEQRKALQNLAWDAERRLKSANNSDIVKNIRRFNA